VKHFFFSLGVRVSPSPFFFVFLEIRYNISYRNFSGAQGISITPYSILNLMCLFLGKEKQYKEIKIEFKLILIYYYQSTHINLNK
jgi:hypothetical protein